MGLLMTFRQLFRFNRIFFFANLAVFVCVIGFFAFGAPFLISSHGTIEASRIILKGERGTPNLVLQGDDEHTLLTLNDSEGNVRLQLQGGVFPAMIMKNEGQEIVGTFFPLKDGGAAVGLGDREGNMATLIRGGHSPMMSFYHLSNQPNLSLGIANELPHLVMVPRGSGEGVLLQGHAPASLLFFDENGEIPVTLSRFGLTQPAEKGEEQVFSTDIQSFILP